MIHPVIRIDVSGNPCPKGSPQIITRVRGKPLRRPRVVADSPELVRWSRTVAGAALVALATYGGERPLFVHCALSVRVIFRLPRPPSEPKRRWPHVKPDLDKLIRATMDPLHRLVFDEDSRIVEFVARKEYATGRSRMSWPPSSVGATITIEPMAEEAQTVLRVAHPDEVLGG